MKEEDETMSLLDEIDELAKKRDSSPAPPTFRTAENHVRKRLESRRPNFVVVGIIPSMEIFGSSGR